MLRTEPFDQLSMDRVAAEAGVSPPLLFHYFKNKKGFQNAILEAASADLEDRMRPDPELPITSQLRSGIETFVDAVIEHPTIYLAVMRMAGSGDVRMRTIYRGHAPHFHHVDRRCADESRHRIERDRGGDNRRVAGIHGGNRRQLDRRADRSREARWSTSANEFSTTAYRQRASAWSK